jgi:prepilin-type N-terminal cleavage/methylation domain-containing protein
MVAKRVSGFTLIELLVVIGIIAALTAIGVPAYNGYTSSAKAREAQNTLQTIFLMQKNYYASNYCYYITPGAADYTSNINQYLLASSTPASGPIKVGTTNNYYFYITGTTGSTCNGSQADSYTAYAKSRIDGTVYSITQENVKTGF